MKIIASFSLFIIVVFVIYGQHLVSKKPIAAASEKSSIPAEKDGIAVLELFTSQGCNSCPAADKLLAQTASEAKKSGKKVITLAYHVDYWDRLGWKDPYSKKEWTNRQYQYGSWFASDNVYTPQLVINGKEELVGSDRNKVEKAIQKALLSPASVNISLANLNWTGKKVTANVNLTGTYEKSNLIIVLVSKLTQNHIPRGENAGITLSGNQVVREMTMLPAGKDLSFSIDIPADLTKENAGLVIFTQDATNHRITGAVLSEPN